MRPVTVYHITPTRNLARIYQRGLDPSAAKDKWGRIWFVAQERIPWAIEKVMRRHNITNPDLLAVITLHVDGTLLRRNRAPGVYQTAHIFKVDRHNVSPARPYLLKG